MAKAVGCAEDSGGCCLDIHTTFDNQTGFTSQLVNGVTIIDHFFTLVELANS